MHQGSSRGFGLLIAYVLPGFTLLLGLATLSEPLRIWLTGAEAATLSVGGTLYVTAASIVAGMILNTFRWVVLDTLHHATGIDKAAWNDALLADRLPAFDRLVEDHFRYYQFYGNTALAALIGFIAWRLSPFDPIGQSIWPKAALLILELALVAASRDALRRYYRRTGDLLASHQEGARMTNGSHPKPETSKPKSDAAAEVKNATGQAKDAKKNDHRK